MADPNQQAPEQKPEEKRIPWKPTELLEIIGNRLKRTVPIVKRLRWGRRKPSKEVVHPLEIELKKRWLDLNDRRFETWLETVEEGWTAQQILLGEGDDPVDPPNKLIKSLMGNKSGIVSLYYRLGAYADIDRVADEVLWFKNGTDRLEEENPYKFPAPEVRARYGWSEPRLQALLSQRTRPWETNKINELTIYPGIVFHEGKEELKEEIYCFGEQFALSLGQTLLNYEKRFQSELYQEAGVPADVRTKTTNAIKAVAELLERIGGIEGETYKMLSGFAGEIDNWYGLWRKLVEENTPEAHKFIIRFPHTYRIIKPSVRVPIQEKIKIRDSGGNVTEEKTIEREVPMYFEPRDIYQEETREKEEEKRGYEREMQEALRREESHIQDLERALTTIITSKRRDLLNLIKSKLPIEERYRQIIRQERDRQAALEKVKQIVLGEKVKRVIDLLSGQNNELDVWMNKNRGDITTDIKQSLELETVEIIVRNRGRTRRIARRITDEEKANSIETKLVALIRIPLVKLRNKYQGKIESVDGRLLEIRSIDNMTEIRGKLKRKADNFAKRPEELGYGLDEYGYPLEIDPRDGTVLIDKWWDEISRNDWQLDKIADKKGGKEALEKHLGAAVIEIPQPDGSIKCQVTNRGSRNIRKVADDKFYGYVDLLEAGSMIYSYWDAVRDDLRDGRYHKHCKTAADYLIEASGGFDENLGAPYFKQIISVWRSKGWGFTRRGVVPTGPINIEKDVSNLNVQIEAKPSDFDDVPDEEKAVQQEYLMRLPDDLVIPSPHKPFLHATIITTQDGKFYNEKRTPTKYNPAFDRRAEHLDYIHWGRMYYWEWTGGINRWSENPFPHYSTRGIGLYIWYFAASDVYRYEEGEELLKGHKMDYGVRGAGKYGLVNPLGGEGILQEN